MKKSEKNELIANIAYFEKKLNELPTSPDTFGFFFLGSYWTKFGAEKMLQEMKTELQKADSRKLSFKVVTL